MYTYSHHHQVQLELGLGEKRMREIYLIYMRMCQKIWRGKEKKKRTVKRVERRGDHLKRSKEKKEKVKKIGS